IFSFTCTPHTLLLHSFPTRRSSDLALLVQQGDAETVDLRLAHVAERRARKGSADPRLELAEVVGGGRVVEREHGGVVLHRFEDVDRKSTRLNSSHQIISYAVFCLKK